MRGVTRDGELVTDASAGEIVEVVLDTTPFYAESGAQIADKGTILVRASASDARLRVLDVRRPIKGLIVHRVSEMGEIAPGATALAQIDPEWRSLALSLPSRGLGQPFGECGSQVLSAADV